MNELIFALEILLPLIFTIAMRVVVYLYYRFKHRNMQNMPFCRGVRFLLSLGAICCFTMDIYLLIAKASSVISVLWLVLCIIFAITTLGEMCGKIQLYVKCLSVVIFLLVSTISLSSSFVFVVEDKTIDTYGVYGQVLEDNENYLLKVQNVENGEAKEWIIPKEDSTILISGGQSYVEKIVSVEKSVEFLSQLTVIQPTTKLRYNIYLSI